MTCNTLSCAGYDLVLCTLHHVFILHTDTVTVIFIMEVIIVIVIIVMVIVIEL